MSNAHQTLSKGDARRAQGNYSDEVTQYYQQAIDDCSNAISLEPSYAEAYNPRGVCYIRLFIHEKVVDDFSEAIKLWPDYAEAYVNRGFTYNNLQQYQKAIDDASEAIQLKSNYPEAYETRSTGYFYLKQYDKEINDLSEAIRLKPDSVSYQSRGTAYRSLGHASPSVRVALL